MKIYPRLEGASMPDADPPPTTIDFGKNFPYPRDLRTGDILFARTPTPIDPVVLVLMTQLLEKDPLGQVRVGNYLGPDLVFQTAMAAGRPDIATQAYVLYVARTPPISIEMLKPKLSPKRVALIIAILMTEFRELTEDWFGLTLLEFCTKPLGRLLLKVFEGNIRDGFFIGHCALVICEDDGIDPTKSEPYVIEANTTSFDQYGVSMHPYFVDKDGEIGAERFRSWASYRASRGDCVWSARPKALIDAAPQTAERIRSELRRTAKLYLGRSYGFFDNKLYGDTGRLYCGEFVYSTFRDVLKGSPPEPTVPPVGEDVRTWQWMRAHNPPKVPGDIGYMIEACFRDRDIERYIRNRKFFILTVQMLYLSAYLKPDFLANGEPYQ
ncbi:MAG: hypothetical protein RET84_02620 [Pseudomonadota bacterium]|nr:hypothetical protein [Pseudomonadota bacterium]